MKQPISFGKLPPEIEDQKVYAKTIVLRDGVLGNEKISFVIILRQEIVSESSEGKKTTERRYRLDAEIRRVTDDLKIEYLVLYLFSEYLEPFCDWKYITEIYSGNLPQVEILMRPVPLKDAKPGNGEEVSCIVRAPSPKDK